MAQSNTNINQQRQEEPDYHEVEILESSVEDEETALHDRKKNCKKDPRHEGFIPVKKFSIEHLPEGHRDQECLDFIKAVINLTVRLVVGYISCGRPEVNYCSSKFRGKNTRAFGSGLVMWVYRKFTEDDGRICPCPQCKDLPDEDKEKQWGKYLVVTAKHVVFDDEECGKTQVDVDYDTDTDPNKCPKLHPVGVRWSNMGEDRCNMCVVSHDRDVCEKLEESVKCHEGLRDKLKNKYGKDRESNNSPEYRESNNSPEYRESNNSPIVCVSHPHGLSKHVSVGEWGGGQEYWPWKWRYTTSTCPGSSGAPVYSLEKLVGKVGVDLGYITHHSGCKDAGHNESGCDGDRL